MRFRYLPPTDQWCSPKDKTPEGDRIMIIISKKTKPALIKKYNLDPNFTVKTISVLNIPASFIGFDKDGSDCWISIDRKIIYIVK